MHLARVILCTSYQLIKPVGGGGRQGMGWEFDCYCWPWGGVGLLTDLVFPGEGIFEFVFA